MNFIINVNDDKHRMHLHTHICDNIVAQALQFLILTTEYVIHWYNYAVRWKCNSVTVDAQETRGSSPIFERRGPKLQISSNAIS